MSRRLLGVSEVVVLPTEKEARLAECASGLGVGSLPGAWKEVGCILCGWEERGLCMEYAQLEKEAKQTGTDNSEKQVEASG